MSELTRKIRELLVERNVTFKEIEHPPTPTCEDSAAARGESLEIGGKTLLLKGKEDFFLFVLSAALSADLKKVRKILGSGHLRMGTHEELWNLAGVEKGALPPFGPPILPFKLFVDESICENSKIAFNAGVLTTSMILSIEDYLEVAQPEITQFAKIIR
ncbi:MAG: hypothetical protein KDD61_02140 [Bdellovibrionales bacterium]|nr:hypothetical protein [Bdellovibrionales bacterium]